MKALAGAVVLLALPSAETAWAASPFDGSWFVTQSCAPTAEDVRGYAWSFPATVRNGVLSGQHPPSDRASGSIRLQGKIKADGSAMLSASGFTGAPRIQRRPCRDGAAGAFSRAGAVHGSERDRKPGRASVMRLHFRQAVITPGGSRSWSSGWAGPRVDTPVATRLKGPTGFQEAAQRRPAPGRRRTSDSA